MIKLTTNVTGIVWLSSSYIAHLARDRFFVRLTLAPNGLGGGVCEVVDGLHGVFFLFLCLFIHVYAVFLGMWD
jgi:hypothetical protein